MACMACVVFSLGTNLGNRLVNLREAVRRLELVPGLKLGDKSSVYETAPWGVTDQPAFLNACVLADCELEPEALLVSVKTIESEMGRVANIRWGARKIDIDILLMNDLVYSSQTLTIPHVNLQDRDFVLVPLREIWPDWVHPKLGVNVCELARLLTLSQTVGATRRPVPIRIASL